MKTARVDIFQKMPTRAYKILSVLRDRDSLSKWSIAQGAQNWKDDKGVFFYISRGELAARARMSVPTVRAACKDLVKLGLLEEEPLTGHVHRMYLKEDAACVYPLAETGEAYRMQKADQKQLAERRKERAAAAAHAAEQAAALEQGPTEEQALFEPCPNKETEQAQETKRQISSRRQRQKERRQQRAQERAEREEDRVCMSEKGEEQAQGAESVVSGGRKFFSTSNPYEVYACNTSYSINQSMIQNSKAAMRPAKVTFEDIQQAQAKEKQKMQARQEKRFQIYDSLSWDLLMHSGGSAEERAEKCTLERIEYMAIPGVKSAVEIMVDLLCRPQQIGNQIITPNEAYDRLRDLRWADVLEVVQRVQEASQFGRIKNKRAYLLQSLLMANESITRMRSAM